MPPPDSYDDLLPFEPMTVPPLYRSEGFAEDLADETVDGAVLAPGWPARRVLLHAMPLAVTVFSAAASVLA